MKINQSDGTGQTAQQVLLTENAVYLWGSDHLVSRFDKQQRDEDLYRRAPSYEDLLQLLPEEILEGRVTEMEGQLCLYVKSMDQLTGEVEQWYVLAENGLLLYADGTLDGQMTYQTRMTELRLEIDDQAVFLLPDGSRPQ